MKSPLIAALFLATAAVASPVFAQGNAHVGDDFQNWEGSSTLTRAEVHADLVRARASGQLDEPRTEYPKIIATGPSPSRAEVKAQLVQAERDGELPISNTSYPSLSSERIAQAAAQQGMAPSQAPGASTVQ
jgi:hypothetical protein